MTALLNNIIPDEDELIFEEEKLDEICEQLDEFTEIGAPVDEEKFTRDLHAFLHDTQKAENKFMKTTATRFLYNIKNVDDDDTKHILRLSALLNRLNPKEGQLQITKNLSRFDVNLLMSLFVEKSVLRKKRDFVDAVKKVFNIHDLYVEVIQNDHAFGCGTERQKLLSAVSLASWVMMSFARLCVRFHVDCDPLEVQRDVAELWLKNSKPYVHVARVLCCVSLSLTLGYRYPVTFAYNFRFHHDCIRDMMSGRPVNLVNSLLEGLECSLSPVKRE